MDAKLAEYRAKKKREQLIQTTKDKVLHVFNNIRLRHTPKEDMKEDDVQLKDEEIDIASISSEANSEDVDENCCDTSTASKFYLYASLWLILYSFAIYLEFGAVYFVISGLYIIWANTRTGPKRRGEVSAYSVFNPNCEAIDGTLKAEQFEKEIRHGII